MGATTPVRTRAGDVPLPLMIGLALALVVGAVAITVGVTYHAATKKPAACSVLSQPLGQLATDVTNGITQSAKGKVDPTPVITDATAIDTLVSQSPGSFATHLEPVVAQVAQMITDGQRNGVTRADLVTLATEIRDAAAFCGLTPHH